MNKRTAVACLLAFTLRSGAPLASGQDPGTAADTAARPVAAGARDFQPGVRIDWAQRRVLVAGRVVQRDVPLEFLACFPGKEHESIVRLEAQALHVYQALGLIGLNPGRPPRWDEASQRFSPPEGDLIDVRLEWQQGDEQRAAAAFDWIEEIEFGRAPLSRPWVFAGSLRRDGGRLAADITGSGIALVDFPESLLSLSGRHSPSNELLWARTRTAAIPELDTPVQLVLQPAGPLYLDIRFDFRGAAQVNGHYASPNDVMDFIRLARPSNEGQRVVLRQDGMLRADETAWRARLEGAALQDHVRWETSASQPAPPSRAP